MSTRTWTAATRNPGTVGTRTAGLVWWRVYRHNLRLLRNTAIAWTLGLAGIGAGVVATFEDRVSTPAELEALRAMEGIPAFEALSGRFVRVDTVEGFTLSRWGMFGILVAVWGMLAAIKLLRGAEDAGHVEPLRAGVITPRAQLAAAMAAVASVFVMFAAAVGLAHAGAGMDPATSWALAAAMGLLGLTFAGVAALACNAAPSRGRAVAIASSVLGLALGVRVLAAASATPDWMWWATPFGWTGFLHEVDGARGKVLGAFAVLVVVLMIPVFALARRDLHSGLIGERLATTRSRQVGGVVGLSFRLSARSAAAWGTVMVSVALVFGLIARDFVEAIAELPTSVELVAQLGWGALDTLEGIVAITFMVFLSVLLAVFSAGQAAAIREEEASWRIEHLLVRPVSRVRWLASRTVASAVALLTISVAAGLGAWLGTSISGYPIEVGDAVLAGLNIVPIAVLFLGVGVAAFALLPRFTAPLTYGLVFAAYLLDFVGPFLDIPDAALDLSPFRYLAAVPSASFDVLPALLMLVVGLVGTLVGVAAFRRRDLKEA